MVFSVPVYAAKPNHTIREQLSCDRHTSLNEAVWSLPGRLTEQILELHVSDAEIAVRTKVVQRRWLSKPSG